MASKKFLQKAHADYSRLKAQLALATDSEETVPSSASSSGDESSRIAIKEADLLALELPSVTLGALSVGQAAEKALKLLLDAHAKAHASIKECANAAVPPGATFTEKAMILANRSTESEEARIYTLFEEILLFYSNVVDVL
jgi:hypothetical protein